MQACGGWGGGMTVAAAVAAARVQCAPQWILLWKGLA